MSVKTKSWRKSRTFQSTVSRVPTPSVYSLGFFAITAMVLVGTPGRCNDHNGLLQGSVVAGEHSRGDLEVSENAREEW